MIIHDRDVQSRLPGQAFKSTTPFLALVFGLCISFIVFFAIPVFFGPSQSMIFPEYVPTIRPIGWDLRLMLSYVQDWLAPGGAPYAGGNPYPPLAMILFWPLTRMEPRVSFAVLSGLTFGAYLWCAGVFPYLAVSPRRLSPSAALLFGIGLFSYPLHFEIERGQWNLIAMALALVGVVIARRRGNLRLLGYVLITVGIQLKIYPAVVALALIGDRAHPRRDLRDGLVLMAANAALFFVLGPRLFVEFIASVLRQVAAPGVWLGNHSIASFAALVGAELTQRGISGAGLLQTIVALTCLVAILAGAAVLGVALWRRSEHSLDAHLILAAALIGVLVPSVSHDYTLAALIGLVGLVLAEEEGRQLPEVGVRATRLVTLRLAALLALCGSFGAVLFSFAYKPAWLANNMPFLLVMFFMTVALRWMRNVAMTWERQSPIGIGGENSSDDG